jgi:protein-disulfide isomerase
VLARHGDAIAFTFIHYPLRMHRFAHRAAVAAECADGQGRFEQYINAVYEKQDSLGLKSWWSYAQAASVPDSVAFESCINGPPSGRIAAGLEWADRLSLTGTPTVIVNGWRLPRAPSANELDDIVRAVQAGRDPFVRPEVDDD